MKSNTKIGIEVRAGMVSTALKQGSSRSQQALLAVATVLTIANASAQQGGTVNFGNHSLSKLVIAQTALPVTANDNVQVALYGAALGSGNFVQLGQAVPVGIPIPGIFIGGTRTAGPATPAGAIGRFQVRAWGGGYASYEIARQHLGVLIGQSLIITNATGNPLGSPPLAPTSLLAGGFTGFGLTSNTVAPTITCATNKTVACGGAWTFDEPTAVDGCASNSIPVFVLSTVTNGQCPLLITRTWGATNACDAQYATCSQTITAVDTVPPVLSCATNKTVECGSAWSFDPPSAWDECGGTNVTISLVQVVTNGVCPALATATWGATDACGNSNSCVQVVTLVDTTPPVLACVSNKTVQWDAQWSFDPPTASDGCSGNNVTVLVAGTTTNASCPPIITRSWVALDACGNSNSCSQAVTVIDTSVPLLLCATNKTVNCEDNWAFDLPTAIDPCIGATLSVWELGTAITNVASCTQLMTRTWVTTNVCNTNTAICSQTVTVICSNCPVIAVTMQCPPNPVPPGGTLAYAGTVTNCGNVTLTGVVVVNDQPAPNTVVFGPIALEPGAGAQFSASYRVPPCSCGPFVTTLVATGASLYGGVATNSVTASCAGSSVYALAGDLNGDGIVDQNELNAVLANYWASSEWVYMTNAAVLGGGFFQFALTNITQWNFTVLASSNLADWAALPMPAYPVFQFYDPEAASNAPVRAYRLQRR